MGRRRRPPGTGSVYQRKSDGRWVAEVTIGFKPNGNPDKERYYCKSEKEAIKKLSEISYKVDQGEHIKKESITVAEWLDKWLWNVKKNQLKPRTFDTYEQSIRLYIVPTIGNKKLQKLDEDDVNKMINTLRNRGLASKTIRYAYVILKGSLEYAVIKKLMFANPCNKLNSVKGIAKEIEPFSQQEQEIFMENIKGTRFEAGFVVLLTTGVRVGELLGLKWMDIDFNGKEIKISRNLQRCRTFEENSQFKSKLIFGEPKTLKSKRSIPLLEITERALKEHRKRQDKEKEVALDVYENNDLVFCTAIGRPIDPKNFSRDYKKILKKANLRDISVHALRHTFATRCIENDMALKALQEILGHSSITTTGDTYAHLLGDKKINEMDKLNKAFTV